MSEIKITDRRMFTSDGELREEFEGLELEETEIQAGAESTEAESPVASDEPPTVASEGAAGAVAPSEPEFMAEAGPSPRLDVPLDVDPIGVPEGGGAPHVELPPEVSPYGTPGFLDLVAMLAEPIAIYLGDAPMPGGESVENLDLARMHIDLLEVLREKTRGNLSSQELTIMDDLLYRLRMRYVEKRG